MAWVTIHSSLGSAVGMTELESVEQTSKLRVTNQLSIDLCYNSIQTISRTAAPYILM